MDQRSIIVYQQTREAEQRFEYFIMGVSTALCAYIGQTFTATKLGLSPKTAEVIAVGALIASIILGFKRLEKRILFFGLNADKLHMGEVRGVLMSHRGQEFLNSESGEVYSANYIEREIAQINKALPETEKAIKTNRESALKLYQWRNWLLVGGLIGLFFAKILEAYF